MYARVLVRVEGKLLQHVIITYMTERLTLTLNLWDAWSFLTTPAFTTTKHVNCLAAVQVIKIYKVMRLNALCNYLNGRNTPLRTRIEDLDVSQDFNVALNDGNDDDSTRQLKNIIVFSSKKIQQFSIVFLTCLRRIIAQRRLSSFLGFK